MVILIITTILEKTVKLMTQLFLFLTLMLVTACAQQTTFAEPLPNLDHLVAFDSDGSAVIRGRISGVRHCPPRDGYLNSDIVIEIPVDVQGIDAGVAVPFLLRFETEILSNLTPHTNARDYLTANPKSSIFDAFSIFETVDVTFVKKDAAFEAVAIRQVNLADMTDQSIAVIDGVFSIDIFSKGTLEGNTNGSNWGDVVTWTISMPTTVHGVEVNILLPINSTDKTQVITKDGAVPVDIHHPGGHVQVDFTRTDGVLEAVRFIEIP